jgi:hypothetical protein
MTFEAFVLRLPFRSQYHLMIGLLNQCTQYYHGKYMLRKLQNIIHVSVDGFKLLLV